ncbi:MAG: hypothetical protein MI864_00710, partial [Pseudomonadales bacterium]|nr:hypothetical protein [Pseudomonadales bacterium]
IRNIVDAALVNPLSSLLFDQGGGEAGARSIDHSQQLPRETAVSPGLTPLILKSLQDAGESVSPRYRLQWQFSEQESKSDQGVDIAKE